jgi:hypothetical protein
VQSTGAPQGESAGSHGGSAVQSTGAPQGESAGSHGGSAVQSTGAPAGGVSGGGAAAGAGQLANTGGGPVATHGTNSPLAAETVLGGMLALLGVALLKPREIIKRFIR